MIIIVRVNVCVLMNFVLNLIFISLRKKWKARSIGEKASAGFITDIEQTDSPL